MTGGTRNITGNEKMSEFFNSNFIKKDVFLKTDGMNIRVVFIKYADGYIWLDMPVEDFNLNRTRISARIGEEIASSDIRFYRKDGVYYVFKTDGITVELARRKEDRKQIRTASAKKTLISRIISDFDIQESFSRKEARHRIGWIKNEISSRLSADYSYRRIFFLGDNESDSRMNWIMDEKDPIFIPFISNEREEDGVPFLAEYFENIYRSDSDLQNEKLVSEITVPLLYMQLLPFAYIQVNHADKLTVENLDVVKNMGITYSESLSRDELLFNPSVDTILISDLSPGGLGMLFKERSLLRHFRENSLVVFTAYMPDNKQVPIMSKIANITLSNDWYRVGCMIENIDSESAEHYEKFISAL